MGSGGMAVSRSGSFESYGAAQVHVLEDVGGSCAAAGSVVRVATELQTGEVAESCFRFGCYRCSLCALKISCISKAICGSFLVGSSLCTLLFDLVVVRCSISMYFLDSLITLYIILYLRLVSLCGQCRILI